MSSCLKQFTVALLILSGQVRSWPDHLDLKRRLIRTKPFYSEPKKLRLKTKPRVGNKWRLCLTFLSEPNSMISDGLNRAGNFGVTLYLLPWLLVSNISNIVWIRNFRHSKRDNQSSIDLLGHIGPMFTSKIH